MKKLIALTLLALSIPAMAQHNHYYGHGHGRGGYGWGWVAPAVITGAIVYGATRPAPPPSVVYVPNPNPQVLPPAPVGYHYEQLLDANCNCYRWVLVQG
jgi:hypothetical protein